MICVCLPFMSVALKVVTWVMMAKAPLMLVVALSMHAFVVLTCTRPNDLHATASMSGATVRGATLQACAEQQRRTGDLQQAVSAYSPSTQRESPKLATVSLLVEPPVSNATTPVDPLRSQSMALRFS